MDVDMDKMPEYNVADENKTAIYEEQKVNYAEEYKKKIGQPEFIHVEIRDGKRFAVVKSLTPEIAKILKDSKEKYDGICIKGFDDFYNGGEIREVVFTPKEFQECAKKIEELTADLKGNNEFSTEEKASILAGRVCQVVATDFVNEFKAIELEKILAQPMTFKGKITMEEANQKWKEQMESIVQEANGDRDFVRANSIIGALIDGKATSQGYADLYKNLMDTLKIPCRLVSGKIQNIETREYESSYWNQVELGDGNWGNINVFDIDKNERNEEKNEYIIENKDKINEAKTIEEKFKILQKLTKIDAKEYVPDRYMELLNMFHNRHKLNLFFSPKLAAREEGIENTHTDLERGEDSLLNGVLKTQEQMRKIGRYENTSKGSMGKEIKRLKLNKGKKYLVPPQNNSFDQLTDEEKETYKKYIINYCKSSKMPEELKFRFIDFIDENLDTIMNYENLSEQEQRQYYEKLQKDIDVPSLEQYISILNNGMGLQGLNNSDKSNNVGQSEKSNEFREGLKVSEDQLTKSDGNVKDDNVKEDNVKDDNVKVKDEELDR